MSSGAQEVAGTLEAMRAEQIPPGHSWLWEVKRYSSPAWTIDPSGQRVPPGTYTALLRYSTRGALYGGESVMSDHLVELRRHLEFILRARGRVLVTGLGLGCVVRGLLLNPRIKSVDVVERDAHVVGMVWPHMPVDRRLALHVCDAHDFVAGADDGASLGSWDFAWHDIWTDEEHDEPHLAIAHQRLMLALRDRVRWQGAWHFPRYLQRVLRERHPRLRAWARPDAA